MKVYTPKVALEILEQRLTEQLGFIADYSPKEGTELYGAMKGITVALNKIHELKKEIEEN